MKRQELFFGTSPLLRCAFLFFLLLNFSTDGWRGNTAPTQKDPTHDHLLSPSFLLFSTVQLYDECRQNYGGYMLKNTVCTEDNCKNDRGGERWKTCALGKTGNRCACGHAVRCSISCFARGDGQFKYACVLRCVGRRGHQLS